MEVRGMTEKAISKNQLKSALETILFLSERPLPMSRLTEIIPEVTENELKEAIAELQSDRAAEGCGVEISEVANGYQMRTKPENSPWIFRMNKARPVRLSRAALETLSICAYRQPVTRAEIDDIRGVDSGPVLKSLLEKNLVRILGKKEEPGSPLIYGTTKEFLEFFSLRNLSDLPSLREYTELGQESLAKLEKLLPAESRMTDSPVNEESNLVEGNAEEPQTNELITP